MQWVGKVNFSFTLEFGVSVNPIPTRGADYAHWITACPPGFENLAASLSQVQSLFLYMFTQVLFLAGNQGNHQNWVPSLLPCYFVFMGRSLLVIQ